MSIDISVDPIHPVKNPYVGPRTFTENERRWFFGRQREARDLLARVVSERLLLFYAQSGAGKSSLLNTRLIPELREAEGFVVLPVGRVSGDLPEGVREVDNIYVYNLLSGLDQGDGHPSRLADLSIKDFLAGLVGERITAPTGERRRRWIYHPGAAATAASGTATAPVAAGPRFALIIDQFEEIITSHPERWKERADFFRQINQALLEDPDLWVVLTLREDYVAALDTYADLAFNRLRARFYMERMGVEAALEAVIRPAERAGSSFAPGVAEYLVDNLRRIRSFGTVDGSASPSLVGFAGNLTNVSSLQSGPPPPERGSSDNGPSILGQYIEPVQLQVVCYQLWENLEARRDERSADEEARITLTDLEQFGDVDQALASFYETALEEVLNQNHAGISAFTLRNWFSKQLITEAGTRGIIFQGETETGGIPNAVVKSLAKTFLLRSELRAGGIWFELVHDRFIVPIVQSNQAWIRRQSPLFQAVQRWLDSERDPSLLLRGRLLNEARREAELASPDILIDTFLAASEAQAEAEQKHFWVGSGSSSHQIPEFERSLAVVIQFPHPYAATTGRNQPDPTVDSFAERLQTDHGYLTHLRTQDVSRYWLVELFTEILPKEVTETDRLLIYISGAGLIRNPGNNELDAFLLPEDGTSDYLHSLLSVSEIAAWLATIKCRHCVTIFDGVFSEPLPFPGHVGLRDASTVAHRAQVDWYLKQAVRQIISIPATVPADHLRFARTFLHQIDFNHPTGVITASELAQHVFKIQESSANLQDMPPLIWNLTPRAWGEYLFLQPNREIRIPPAPQLHKADNPYRGLKPYEKDDANLFFGRERLIREIANRVDLRQLTVVLGSSGTGKSSLVKAGLMPYLSRRGSEGSHGVGWHVLTPMRPLHTPLDELAHLLETELTGQALTGAEASPQQASDAITAAVDSWIHQHPRERLLLIVDQLEEVVTMCRDPEARVQFLELLAGLLETYPKQLRVVFTLRSDFEPHFNGSELGRSLASHWKQARYVVTQLNRSELRDVVELPAASLYLDFHPPALVDTLIDEVEQMPGALSLLSFTLSELFVAYLHREEQARSSRESVERSLTASDYSNLGGVIGALSRRATDLYNSLDTEQQATMQRIMLRMVAVEGGELARRRVPRAELDYPLAEENARVAAVLEQMALAQLVLEGSDEDGIPYVEPVHDALVRSWDKLLVWKREAEDLLPLQRRLTQVALEWEHSSEPSRGRLLWHNDPRLPLLQEELAPSNSKGQHRGLFQNMGETLWPSTTITDQPTWLNRLETQFVQASIVKRSRDLRKLTSLIVAVVLLFAMLAGLAGYQSVVANRARSAALMSEAEARQAEATAVVSEAEARQAEATAVDALAVAETNAAAAGQARTVSHSRQLAAQSAIELSKEQADLALLVALESRKVLEDTGSFSLDDSEEAYRAIRTALVAVQGTEPRIEFSAGGDILEAIWDSDERRVLIRTDYGPVSIWDSQTGEVLSFAHNSLGGSSWGPCPSARFPIWSASWSRDEQRILTRGADGTVRIWHARTGQEMVRFGADIGDIWSVRETPDGRCVYHNSRTGEETMAIGGHDEDMWQATWSRDESRVLTRSAAGFARIWDAETGDELVSFEGHQGDVWGATWSQDETRLLTWSDDDTARLWNAQSGDELAVLAGHEGDVLKAVWRQDKTQVLTLGADATVRIWDATTGREVAALRGHTGPVLDAVWNRDEQQVLTWSHDGTARIWSASNGEAIVVLAGHDGEVWGAAWSQDEQLVLTYGADMSARIWHAKTGEQVALLKGHQANIWKATWNRDESQVLTNSADGTAAVWDARNGYEPIFLRGHTGAVWEAVWSSDAGYVLTRGADDTVRIWDAQTGEELVRLAGHLDYVREAQWSRDGSRVLTYGNDNTVRLWYVDRGGLTATACQHVSTNMTVQQWRQFRGAERYRATCANARLPADLLQTEQAAIDSLLQEKHFADALAQALVLEEEIASAGQAYASMLPRVVEAIETEIRGLIKEEQVAEALAHARELYGSEQPSYSAYLSFSSAEEAVAVALYDIGVSLARDGEIARSIANFSLAQTSGYPRAFDPETEARQIAGDEWLGRAQALVDTLDVGAVTDALQQALSLNPALTFEPEQRAGEMVAEELIARGRRLAIYGEIDAATEMFERVLTLVDVNSFGATPVIDDPNASPLVVEAEQLVRSGKIADAISRFEAERARMAALRQSHQLAAAAVRALVDGEEELALLLSIESYRALPSPELRTAADAVDAHNAVRATLARAQWRTPGLAPRIHLDPGDISLDWQDGDVAQAVWSEDERRILTRDSRGLVGIWDLESEQEAVFFHNHELFMAGFGHAVWQAIWSQDEDRVLTYGADGTARIWDPEFGTMLVSLEGHAGDVWQATWNEDGGRVLTRSADGTTRIWDATTGEELTRLQHNGDIWGAVWSRDEARVLTYGDDDTARIWDVETGDELTRLEGHTDDILQAVWSHDEARVLTSSADATARLWDAESGEQLICLCTHQGYLMATTWSQDEHSVLTLDAAGVARIWDVESGEEVARLGGHEHSIIEAQWSEDESRILTRSDGRTVHIWRTQDGRPILSLDGHAGTVLQAVWNSAEDRVLTTSTDGTARIWSAENGEELVHFSGHRGTVFQATWNQDETQILTRGDDGTVRVWNADTGKEEVQFAGHTDTVHQATWSRDGSRVMTRSDDGTVRIWTVHPDELLLVACQYVSQNMGRADWAYYMESEPYRATCDAASMPDMERAEQRPSGENVEQTVSGVRTARVGLMGRNTSDFEDPDYALLQEANIEAIVLLSTIDPRIFAKIKRQNPNILIITRLYMYGKPVGAQQFIASMTPVLERLRPYSTHFEIWNEPNHADGIEGWGSSDADAQDFNVWFQEIYQGLKSAHPWAQLGFPGLATPDAAHRDKAWLQFNQDAITMADWLGVHAYWQTPPDGESSLYAECCGLNFRYYHERYPDKVLHITEFGNANGLNSIFSTHEFLYAEEYAQWLTEVFNYPYIGSASAFIMSSPDQDWESFTWRDETGRTKAVVSAVGKMPRPALAEESAVPITSNGRTEPIGAEQSGTIDTVAQETPPPTLPMPVSTPTPQSAVRSED